MKSSNGTDKLSYKDFCTWMGQAIEPNEDYYFSHDNGHNPGYSKAIKKFDTSKDLKLA